MTVDLRPPPAGGRSALLPRGRRGRGVRPPDLATRWVVVGALVAVALRLPYVRTPLRSDEGGFLLVASQWHPGTSLYGSYWVDRPPLLIAFYALADRLGGATALRLLGCGLVFAVVLVAHLLGRTVTRRVTPWPAVLALALVVMPWGGAFEVNGELVAVPLVLLGLLAALRASDEPERDRRWRMWAAAGALGAAAAMVKQDFLDVLVFSAVLVLVSAWDGHGIPGPLRRATAELGTLGAGAAAAGVAIVLGAGTRGTTPAGLWDALVLFRLDASRVIADSASSATDARFHDLLLAMCMSGSVALVLVFAAHAVRQWRQPVVVATTVLLAWELFGVLAGGSYWLHYLVGLVPGLVLAAALVTTRTGLLRTAARTIVSYAAAAAAISTPLALVTTPPSHETPAAASWLQRHARPGDTATLLYGAANILQAAGLTSPYSELWSLPIRVRDPHLVQLQHVLRGPEAPTWLLASDHLRTWGVSSGAAFALVSRRYHAVATVDGYTVYRLQYTDHPRPKPSRSSPLGATAHSAALAPSTHHVPSSSGRPDRHSGDLP